MSKVVTLLRSLSNTQNQKQLMSALKLTELELLELIGKINQFEANLISNHSSSKFCLTRELDWLEIQHITHYLQQLQHYDYTVIIIDELMSTNSIAMSNLTNYANKTVLACEYQTNGRGRLGRQWISKIAHDITASFIYIFEQNTGFELLPLVSAIAINRVFKDLGLRTYIKWPNDIYLENKTKIAGVLVESRVSKGKRYIVIGVGVNNVLSTKRNKLLAYLVKNLDQVVLEYTLTGFASLRREWLDSCIHYKQNIIIYKGQEVLSEGIHSDLTIDGELVLDSDSEIKKYRNFDISLKILYSNRLELQ